MSIISFSEDEKSIEEIWNWYEDQIEALRDFRYKVISAVSSPKIQVNEKFFNLTLAEIEEYFSDSEEELEHLVSLNLVSATEALLRLDFLRKVEAKDKSDLGRIFRNIQKDKGNRVSLETDIIDNWNAIVSTSKTDFSNFIALLRYRHWLAHGRYWNPKLGRGYDALTTYAITEKIFEIVKVTVV